MCDQFFFKLIIYSVISLSLNCTKKTHTGCMLLLFQVTGGKGLLWFFQFLPSSSWVRVLPWWH